MVFPFFSETQDIQFSWCRAFILHIFFSFQTMSTALIYWGKHPLFWHFKKVREIIRKNMINEKLPPVKKWRREKYVHIALWVNFPWKNWNTNPSESDRFVQAVVMDQTNVAQKTETWQSSLWGAAPTLMIICERKNIKNYFRYQMIWVIHISLREKKTCSESYK